MQFLPDDSLFTIAGFENHPRKRSLVARGMIVVGHDRSFSAMCCASCHQIDA